MGGCHCHQERQWEGAATRKMAHFGKGIKRVAESVEKLLQGGLEAPVVIVHQRSLEDGV